MNNITIAISRDEYDTIIKAIDFYNESIKQRLADQAQTWITKQEGKKILAISSEVLRKEMDSYVGRQAPWGFKKDGTPKKQPGRKALS